MPSQLEATLEIVRSRITPLTPGALLQAQLQQSAWGLLLPQVESEHVRAIEFEIRDIVPERYVHQLSAGAVERLLLGHSVLDIARDIVALPKLRSIELAMVRGICGLRVDDRIVFSPTVYVDIPARLRACVSREILFRLDPLGNPIHHFGLLGSMRPTAALVVMRRKSFPPPDGLDLVTNEDFEDSADCQVRAFHALALAGDCAPQESGQSNWLEHPALGYGAGGGGAAGIIQPMGLDGQTDATEAKRLYELSWRLSQPDWSAVKLACEHLIQSRCAHSLTNRAIELRVATEVVLRHDDRDANSEIGYKIGTRAASLLGGTAAEKRATFDAVQKGYRVTSAAIHNGILERSEKSLRSLKSLEDISCRAIKRVLDDGHFPSDWTALVLGSRA